MMSLDLAGDNELRGTMTIDRSHTSYCKKNASRIIPPILTKQKHTTGGIPRWSPTLVLVARFSAYVWQSGRDAQFSLTYGRMCLIDRIIKLYRQTVRAAEELRA